MTQSEDQLPPAQEPIQPQPARRPDAGTPASRPLADIHLSNDQAILGVLLESLAEGLIGVDQDGAIVLANRRAEEMFGYDPGGLLGRPLSDLLPERSAAAHAGQVASYFANPRPRPMGHDLNLFGRRKDGTEFPVDVSLSFVNTPAGPLTLSLVTDASRIRQAEQALKQRNQELDAFAHTVAHDLKASLSLLVGYSQILLETQDTLPAQDRRKFLQIMDQTGRKMHNIVDELLLLASMRREDVPVAPMEMAEIVAQALERLEYVRQEHQAQIVLPASYPQAVGYAPWVEEVWLNYISNALKYGGRPPHVELGAQLQDDGYVKFWVKDNGAGLSAEQLARLFTPYARMGQPHINGYGLGLSIVWHIVEKLSGRVGAESEPGQGSVFSFYLPKATD
jgi:PAS domain S-box-containing protein